MGLPGLNPEAALKASQKIIRQRCFSAAGVPAPRFAAAASPQEGIALAQEIGWPVVVKPSKQGSTVGLEIVREEAGLAKAIDVAAQYDDEVMVEAFVPGRELTVGVLGNQALAVGEIIPRHEIFDYECKYTPGMAEEVFPAKVSPDVTARCQDLGLKAHQALKLGGYSRVDFRLTGQEELVCLEVNTLPGMTSTSLLPQSARAVGIEFPDLCERICIAARERFSK